MRKYAGLFILTDRKKKGLTAALLVLLAFLSIFGVGRVLDNPSSYASTLDKLNDKENELVTITTAAAAAATVLAAVPDDSTTPVASEIADFASYTFLISILIRLERIVVTLSGYLVFKWLIPIALGFVAVSILLEERKLKRLGLRLIAFGLCLVSVVPISLAIDERVGFAFDPSDSIASAIEEDIEDSAAEDDGEKTFFQKAGDFFTNLFSKAKDLANEAVNLLNKFINLFVSLFIRDFIIPILTYLAFVNLLKFFFYYIFDKTPPPSFGKHAAHRRHDRGSDSDRQ